MNELANCRICLDSRNERFSIYENVKSKNLPHLIEEISGVVINALKEPNAAICFNCSDDILQAQITIQKCRQSDKILLEQQQVKCVEAQETTSAIDNGKNLKHEAIGIQVNTAQDDTNLTEADFGTDVVDTELIEANSSYRTKDGFESDKAKRKLRTTQPKIVKSKSEQFKCTRQLRKRAITSETSTARADSNDTRKYIRKINVNKDYYFQCEQCTFTSYFATYFREHMQQLHNVTNPRIFKCQKCSQTFLEYRYLQQHIAFIHEQQPRRKKFLCSECGQGFDKSNHLYYHQRSHLPKEQRPIAPLVKCEHCDKEFSKLSIRMHIKNIHSAERPFACTLCRSSFALAKGLQAHMKVCHPTELFICPCCEVRFRVRSVYETHVQRGTCQKLGHNCNYCAWGFKTKDRLEKHKLQVHKELLRQQSESGEVRSEISGNMENAMT